MAAPAKFNSSIFNLCETCYPNTTWAIYLRTHNGTANAAHTGIGNFLKPFTLREFMQFAEIIEKIDNGIHNILL